MLAADLLPDDPAVQLEAGRIFLQTGEFEGARQRAARILKIDPKNVDAQILTGNALAGLKNLDGAIEQVEKAIETDPRRTLSYTNLAMLQSARGDRQAAEVTFKQ